MGPRVAAALRKADKLRERLARARETLQQAIRDLDLHDKMAEKGGVLDQRRREALEKAVEEARDARDLLDGDLAMALADLAREQAAEAAIEHAGKLKKIRELLDAAKNVVKRPAFPPLLIAVFVAIGISAYMLLETEENIQAMESMNVDSLGPAPAPAANSVGDGPLADSVDANLEQKPILSYKLAKTKITKSIPGGAAQESEVSGSETSIDLATTGTNYTSSGKLTVKVPPKVGHDKEVFTVSGRIEASWDLKATVYNLNVGVNVLGVGKSDAIGDPNPWPQPGSYSLSAEASHQATFADSDLVRRWTENGKSYRSFTIGGHTGVVQTLSTGSLTFIYEEE